MDVDRIDIEQDRRLECLSAPQVSVLMQAIFRSLERGRLTEGSDRKKPATSRQAGKQRTRSAVSSQPSAKARLAVNFSGYYLLLLVGWLLTAEC
jgi:hypothetical protein